VFGVPVVGQLDERRVAAGALAGLDQAGVVGTGEEDQGVAVLVVDAATNLCEPELVAVEVESGVEIADTQHGMKVTRWSLLLVASLSPGRTGRRRPDGGT